jgi:hypothetical protein
LSHPEPDLTDLDRDLAVLEDLVGQAAELEREISIRLLSASANGASHRRLEDATGMSRSTVARRLNGSGSVASGDAEYDEWQRAIQAERLKLAKLRTAREATRLQWAQDAAALTAEANAITRIGSLDA